MQAMNKLMAAMESFGLTPCEIVPDGKIHRFPVGKSKTAGWYVVFADSEGIGAAFGDWISGDNQTWSSVNPEVAENPERRAAFNERVKQAKDQAARQRKEDAEHAARKAAAIWAEARDIEGFGHPYLEKKKITGKGLRLENGTPNLIVPMYAEGQHLVGVQRINPDGEKYFLSGANLKGACNYISGKNDRLYVCEGQATAESVFSATGKTTFTAFNAGNLLPVCEKIRKNTQAPIVICADEDLWSTKADKTPYNAGRKKALEVASRVENVTCLFPVFQDTSTRPTDFNDLYCLEGIDALVSQVLFPFEHKRNKVIERVQEWVTSSSGKFRHIDLDRDLDIRTQEDKGYRQEALVKMEKEGLIEKVNTAHGTYRTRDFEVEFYDFSLIEGISSIPFLTPLDIGVQTRLAPNNVILLAGEKNAGKTTFALLTAMMNQNNFKDMGKKIFYMSSEAEKHEMKNSLDRLGGVGNFEQCSFMYRQYEPYDVIHSNKEMQDGLVIIDFLESREGEYFKVTSEIKKIHEAMGNGLALVLIQKGAGKEFGKGGEGTTENARLAINLDKMFSTEKGNVCRARITKNKYPAEGRANIDGKSSLYFCNGREVIPLTQWGYMNEKTEKTVVDSLKEKFGIRESDMPAIMNGAVDYIQGI